jgi:Putative beta-barrel porin-2, OmpL-like. bbp2
MEQRHNTSHFLLTPLALALMALPGLVQAEAKPLGEAATLLEAVGDPNGSSFMKDNNLKFGGWLNTGVTYNAASPDNKFNGPVTFADRAEELQLNQINLYFQKAVTVGGDAWDWGGRVDVMYGSDAIFTQAYGVPAYDVNTAQALNRSHWDLNMLGSNDNRFYDLAFPQAYVEFNAPIGNGLDVKVGHFYTPIGYETVPAPDNFFYTHAYTMQYGEPFTHTGALANYAIDDNWAVMGGVITGSATGGWDGGWDKHLGNWAGIAGGTWTSTDKNTSLNISGTYGGTSEQSSNSWGMYSIVGKHNITEKMHLMVQHDHGFAGGTYDFATATPNAIDAEWYGLNTHLTYDVMDNLVAGVRGEWFRDQNGFRVCSPGRVAAATYDSNGTTGSYAANFLSTCSAASYYAVTAGVTWKPVPWATIRPNVRYDWADGSVAGGGQYRPFGNNKQDQLLFSTDVTLLF